MNKPATMTDFEFVQRPELTQKNHLYLYRDNSALLRSAVRARVMRQAELDGRELKDISTYSQRIGKPRSLFLESEDRGSAHADCDELPGSSQSDTFDKPPEEVLLPSLRLTVAEISLFDNTALAVRDLGDKTLKQPSLGDIEEALDLISTNAAQHSLCLLVPEKHAVVKTEAWNAAVDAIGLIEEPMVTPENYLAVARSYFPQSRLGDLRHLSDNRLFLSRLRKLVEQGTCTPFALSIQIDMIVLGGMEGGEFREIDEVETKRRERWVLPETLRRFLDNRDPPSFSALMRLVDRLRFDRMLEPLEILTRLYRATTGTLESRDKRYRRLDDPLHCVWAALLLATERSFLNGNAFVAMDYLCQRYSRAAGALTWFSSTDGWQAIAPLLEINATVEPSRLDNARLELQRTLRARLKAMKGDDVDWFHFLIRLSEDRDATDASNEQLLMAIGEVG